MAAREKEIKLSTLLLHAKVTRNIYQKVCFGNKTYLGMTTLIQCLCRRNFSSSATDFGIRQWRIKNNIGSCGNEFGPLTDLPDWSYADGRPAPLNSRQKKKLEKKKAMTDRIVTMLGEIKLAKDLRADQIKKQKEIERRIDSKRIKTKT